MITLYSTGCPKCTVLKQKLHQANIEYIENHNVNELLAKGIQEVPVIKLENGSFLSFAEAVKMINFGGLK